MTRSALVTGAADRLGRAMAIRLAELGFDVAVHFASSEAKAKETVAMIEALGRKAVALRADLLDEAEVDALIPAACAAVGQLSVLVNNASIFEYDTLQTATQQSWDRHMLSNLQAPYFLTQAFAKQAPPVVLIDEEPVAQACVVNLIDQRVRKLTPEFSTYTLAKTALWTFTQTAAQGLAPAIRVNAIGPGPTLKGGRQSVSHFTRQRQNTVLGRGSDPKDICDALEYFVGAKAVTGQLLCVDGGQHLGWQTPDVLGVE